MPVVVNGIEPRNVRLKHAFVYAGCGRSFGYRALTELGIKPAKMGRVSLITQAQAEQLADYVIHRQARVHDVAGRNGFGGVKR